MNNRLLATILLVTASGVFAQKVEVDVSKLPNYMSKELEAGLVFAAFAKGQLPADKKEFFTTFWLGKNRNSSQKQDEFQRRDAETQLRANIPELESAVAKILDWVDDIGTLNPYDFDKGGFPVLYNPGYGTLLGNLLVLDPAGLKTREFIVPVPESVAKEARQRRDWYKTKAHLTYRINGPISVNPVQGPMSTGALLIPIQATKVQIVLGDGTVLGEIETGNQ